MNHPIIFSCLMAYFGFYLFFSIFPYNLIKLGRDIKTGKRKFYYATIKAHIWENDGKYEFNSPEIFKEPYRVYLKNHHIVIQQLIEVLKTKSNSHHFAAVDRAGNWDYSFKDKSRGSFNTFHVDKSLVLELKPIKFLWRDRFISY